ncbi:MAG TPA: hypothetical protein VGD55_07690, partial [Acidothermaceae bacterium]
MRTAAIPDAAPLPPLLPTTVGWRWPWLVGTLVLIVTAGGLLLPALEMGFQLGTSDDEQYTSWVGTPRVEAYFAVIVVSLATFGLLCFRRWNQRTRNVMFAVCALFGVACGGWGVHESGARRYIGPALAAAVKAVPHPAGATSSGPITVNSDEPAAYLDLLGEPSAWRSWKLPTDSASAACAAVTQMVGGGRGWEARVDRFYCEFDRKEGRVLVRVSDNQLGSTANTIYVTAYPN